MLLEVNKKWRACACAEGRDVYLRLIFLEVVSKSWVVFQLPREMCGLSQGLLPVEILYSKQQHSKDSVVFSKSQLELQAFVIWGCSMERTRF